MHRTHIILCYAGIVQWAKWSRHVEYGLQTLPTEEVATLCLHWVPHGMETDGTLVPLEEGMDKVLIIATMSGVDHFCNYRHKTKMGPRIDVNF